MPLQFYFFNMQKRKMQRSDLRVQIFRNHTSNKNITQRIVEGNFHVFRNKCRVTHKIIKIIRDVTDVRILSNKMTTLAEVSKMNGIFPLRKKNLFQFRRRIEEVAARAATPRP